MAKNTRPMLTVLVDEDKLQKFRDYASSQQLSMGAIVNDLLDRLMAGSIDAKTPQVESSIGLSRLDIEQMISKALDDKYRAGIEPAIEPIDSIHKELAELRAAIELRPLWDDNAIVCPGDFNKLEYDTNKRLDGLERNLVSNTARMDRDDYTFIKDVMETLRDDKDYRKLPEQFERQDERIDLWVEKAQERDDFLRELDAKIEAIVEVYSKITKSVEHNCDRLVVLEKMNGVVYKSNEVIKVGTGFGKH